MRTRSSPTRPGDLRSRAGAGEASVDAAADALTDTAPAPRLDPKLAADAAAWAGNVASSVAIIFVNKVLMSAKAGHGFVFATTLCALHYLACAASTAALNATRAAAAAAPSPSPAAGGGGGGAPAPAPAPRTLPRRDLAIFTATANASIVSLNLSLMLNKVGFYQVAKLLIIPFVCGVERVWLGRRFPPRVAAAVAVVVAGVAVVTVTDVTSVGGATAAGAAVAALSVVSSGMQQILCRVLQQAHGLTSHELLSVTAPAQAITLLAVGPFLDRHISGAWVFDYAWTPAAALTLLASCTAAVAVNVSQFACLGRFSAVSFQVLGHAKTVAVLLGGWALLGDTISARQAAGMALAVAGMVAYGAASASAPAAPPLPGGGGRGRKGGSAGAGGAGGAGKGAGVTSPYKVKATV